MIVSKLARFSRFAAFSLTIVGILASHPVICRADDDSSKVKLSYKFHKGQIVRYDVIMNDDYDIQVGLDKDAPYSHQKSVKSYQVKAVKDDGSAILELTIESVQLEIHQNGETFRYDSSHEREKEDQPVFLAMANLVGKPHLQLRISTQGEVSAFVPLVDGKQVPDNPGQAAFDVLLHLPDDPVAVGETWREDFEISLPIPDSILRKTISMQRRYTLESLEGSLATIALTTKVLSPLNGPEDEIQLLRRKPHGKVVIDLEKGLLVSKSMSQDNQVTGFEKGASLMRFRQTLSEKMRTGNSPASPTAAATTPVQK